MSMVTCVKCDRYVDTDFDVEGVWVDDKGQPNNNDPTGLVCSFCVERHFTPEQIEEYENQ